MWRKKLGKRYPSQYSQTYEIPWCDSKQVKDLYDKNFKPVKKVIAEDLRKWKDPTCSQIGRINIVKKWPSYKKQSTDSVQSPSKFQINSS